MGNARGKARGRAKLGKRALAAVHHPCMVQVYGMGRHRGVDYLVMERLHGVSLMSYLARRRLTAQRFFALFSVNWLKLSILGACVLFWMVPMIVSLATTPRPGVDTIDTTAVRYKTSTGFNIGALGVILILIALYATWW